MSTEVAVVVSPRDWAEQLHRFVADHGGARVRARVLDAREAVEETYQVLIAEDLTSFLTPRLVTVLRRDGRRVLGVYEPTEPSGRQRLLELGVDEVIPADASPERMLRAIEALAISARVDLDAELATITEEQPPVDAAPAAPQPRGRVVAVGGPSGGPGATEVAIGLSCALLARRRSAAIVDVDDVAPSVLQRLGLALHPNLRTAVDAVHHLSAPLESCLVGSAPGGPAVLGGLSSPRDWSELRPGEVVDVLRELTHVRAAVVANVSHRLEELGGYGAGASRYRLARSVLADADMVVGVCAPTPVGLGRFLDWLADVHAITRAPVHVVINRAPTRSFVRGELEEELRRTYSPPTLAFVPHDRRVEEAAWDGALVGRGGFTRALDWFAERLLASSRDTAAATVGHGS